jgi:UDPglucose--hexose-1-phosphate uridylyltransferase
MDGMPDLRRDPVTGELVLLAPGRATRPHTVAATPTPPTAPTCPFCEGHERKTPPEVFRTGAGAPDAPGWRVRVVPNLYPIVGGPEVGEGAGGAHEVVVLSPDHNRSFGMLTDDEAVEVLTVMRDRARHHLAAGRAFVQVLVNHGRAAGASIAHPHAQVVALEFVPPAVTTLASRFEAATRDPLTADRECDPELQVSSAPAATWCPWASRAPYTMRVAAPEPVVSFDAADDGAIAAVAVASRDALARVRQTIHDPAYNLVVYTAPPTGCAQPYWFVEIVPRTSVVAGFEQGTGVLVNTVTPEAASEVLRAAQP